MGISREQDLDAKIRAERGDSFPRTGASRDEQIAFQQYKTQAESRKAFEEAFEDMQADFRENLRNKFGGEGSGGKGYDEASVVGGIAVILLSLPLIWYFTLDDSTLKMKINGYLKAIGVFIIVLSVGWLLLKRLGVKSLFKRISYSFLTALTAGILTHAIVSPAIGLYVDDLIYNARKLTAGRIPPSKFLGRYWEHGYYDKPYNIRKEGELYILTTEFNPKKQPIAFTYNEEEDQLEGVAVENGIRYPVYIKFDPDYGNIFITSAYVNSKWILPEHLLRYDKLEY